MMQLRLPTGTTHVRFDELAHRIADALHPDAGAGDDRFIYATTRINLEDELKAAVMEGTLPVRDPLTRGPHTFPHGEALNSAVVAVDNLRQFIKGRDLQVVFDGSVAAHRTTLTAPPLPRYLTLDEAAEALCARTGEQWSARQILECGARHQVTIWGCIDRAARFIRMEPIEGEPQEITAEAESLPRLAAAAIYALQLTGKADVLGWDRLGKMDVFADEPIDVWKMDFRLAPGEVAPMVRMADCRVSAEGVERLATAYSLDKITNTAEDEGGPFTNELPAWLPTQAKDMRGLDGDFIRGHLEAGDAEALRHGYGINEDEARLSLCCAELATLPAWDAEALLEAATVYVVHSGHVEEAEIAASTDRAKRRIRLALLAEGAAPFMTPADGVLLLRRAGISVFHELFDAVAMEALNGSDPEKTYRRLKGIAEPDHAKAESMVGALADAKSEPMDSEVMTSDAPAETAAGINPETEMSTDCLATREQIEDAFGVWGLKPGWFDNFKDRRWLRDARKRKGQGQRGHTVKPLFCPYEVMQGLVKTVRGRRMSEAKGWDVLEHKFPATYSRFSIGDPRERTG